MLASVDDLVELQVDVEPACQIPTLPISSSCAFQLDPSFTRAARNGVAVLHVVSLLRMRSAYSGFAVPVPPAHSSADGAKTNEPGNPRRTRPLPPQWAAN